MWLPFEGFLFAHPKDIDINDEYADFLRSQMIVICSIGDAIKEPCAVRFAHPAWRFTPDIFYRREVSDAEKRMTAIAARRSGHDVPSVFSVINFSNVELPNALNAHRRGVWPHDLAMQATLLNAADTVVIGAAASEIDLARALCCESRLLIDSTWFGHEMMPAFEHTAKWFDISPAPAMFTSSRETMMPSRTPREKTWDMRLQFSRQLIDDTFAAAGIMGLRAVESEIQATQHALTKPRFIPLDDLKLLNGTAVPPAVLMR
jgi:hypothetical protein